MSKEIIQFSEGAIKEELKELVCARLRHVAGTQWGNQAYLNTKRLDTLDGSKPAAG